MPESTQIAGTDVLTYIGKTEALIERVDNLADKVDALVDRMNGCNPVEHEALLEELQHEIEGLQKQKLGWTFWAKGAAWIVGMLTAAVVLMNNLGLLHIHLVAR